MKSDKIFAPVNAPKTKEIYEAPVVESIEVRVEQGFQETLDGLGGGTDGPGSW